MLVHVVGKEYVGKTSLISQLTDEKFVQEYIQTECMRISRK